ncbi:MAG: hypothetical protein R3194_09265, partial [Limnobacter sp.]|nr:hypothetical protein [Limnobacter sp.]
MPKLSALGGCGYGPLQALQMGQGRRASDKELATVTSDEGQGVTICLAHLAFRIIPSLRHLGLGFAELLAVARQTSAKHFKAFAVEPRL